MKKRVGAAAAFAAVVVAVVALAVHHHPPKPVPPLPPATTVVSAPTSVSPVSSPVSAVCHVRGLLPDPVCTPGAINPNVTQANIHQTICVKGWTATIRPPQSYTEPLKIQSIKAYGYVDTKLADYEEDHLISLELGGNPTDVKNLWAEPGRSPNPKDGVEGKLRAEVCSGKITLAAAQHAIATDWVHTP